MSCVESQELPPDTEIGRVSLAAKDRDLLKEYYHHIVGLSVTDRAPDKTVFGDRTTAILELTTPDTTTPSARQSAGLFHLAIRVPDREQLAARLRAIENHTQLAGASDHGVSEALYLRDPEGNGVEIYRDRERTAWPRSDDGALYIPSYPLDLDSLRSMDVPASTAMHSADIGHIHLNVTDIEQSRRFYRDVVGFPIQFEAAPGAVFFGAGGYHHHLAINVWNKRTEPYDGAGLNWFELRVDSQDDIARLTERLEANETSIKTIEGGIQFEDPDGIPLRCTARDA